MHRCEARLEPHGHRRTCYAGDYTARTMLHALFDQVEELGIPVHQNRDVSRLMVGDRAHNADGLG